MAQSSGTAHAPEGRCTLRHSADRAVGGWTQRSGGRRRPCTRRRTARPDGSAARSAALRPVPASAGKGAGGLHSNGRGDVGHSLLVVSPRHCWMIHGCPAEQARMWDRVHRVCQTQRLAYGSACPGYTASGSRHAARVPISACTKAKQSSNSDALQPPGQASRGGETSLRCTI